MMFMKLAQVPAKSILLCTTSKIGTSIPRFRFGTRNRKVIGNALESGTINEAGRTFKLVAAGSSAVGIGVICTYALSQTNERFSVLEKAAMWPPYVRERVHSTYAYLAASTGITAASAMAVWRNPTLSRMMATSSIPAMILGMVAVIGTSIVTRMVPYEQTAAKHAAWLVHCGTLGMLVSPVCMLGGAILQRAGLYTLGIVGGLSAVAYTAPSDKFLYMGAPLAMGLGLVLVSSIAGMFLNPLSKLGAGMMAFQLYGGLALFSGFLLYDTQLAVKRAEQHPPQSFATQQYGTQPAFDPINNCLHIYLDTVNIFIRMATILGMGGSKKK